ncbi:MAG: hypothetical protein QW734_06510 [Candidatus Bathyarchaeia archaeon]
MKCIMCGKEKNSKYKDVCNTCYMRIYRSRKRKEIELYKTRSSLYKKIIIAFGLTILVLLLLLFAIA